MENDAEWQILAEEAAQEKDPEKLMKIIEALSHALDAHRNGTGNAKERGAA
jgi:hypothetical protein